MTGSSKKTIMVDRFRSFLPVVIDVETGGFNAKRDAMLEIAAVILKMDEHGQIYRHETHSCHVMPFEGANIDQAALDFTGIDPHHPFRFAVPEEEVVKKIFNPIRAELKETKCTRAIMVAHNAFFDQGFVNAMSDRTGAKNPFHAFSSFDTATLAGLAYGQTVLAKAVQAAGIKWDGDKAHSAIYDTERTADLFCKIVNTWDQEVGFR